MISMSPIMSGLRIERRATKKNNVQTLIELEQLLSSKVLIVAEVHGNRTHPRGF